MGTKRKYTTTAYIPRVLAVLAESKSPMTRKQIAAVIGTTPESIATAMLDLTRSGEVVKIPHTPHVAATYRLPVKAPVTHHSTRVWTAPQAFPWNVAAPVTLPREPWADTVPTENMGAGQDARKPRGVSA